MKEKIIAWDLGTGGNKASLYNVQGQCLASEFVSYETRYPHPGWHEQRPEDWWNAVVQSTRKLLETSGVNPAEICCCGISGHSLGVVPISLEHGLLQEFTPIWSDTRAVGQTAEVFARYPEEKWYGITGNGFTPAMYAAFKILWYRDNAPEMFSKIDKVIGTKDYINWKLTGCLATDPSYASGYGVWDLKGWKYSEELIEVMGFSRELLPDVVPSTQVIGYINKQAASLLGLKESVQVVAGGVDNSCMALGAKAFREGRVYSNLGSSCWIAVSSQKPLLDSVSRPYVFSHVVPGYFASALCIAAGGTSFRWVRDHLCRDLSVQAEQSGSDVYELMTKEAMLSPEGANRVLFNPSLGGGMPIDKSPNIRGGFIGLDLSHTRADLIRATMEGISFGLRTCLDKLKELTEIDDAMLLVGGGSKSALWRKIYADIYRINVLKSNVDQQAAALGAAACAAVGTGLWKNFDLIDSLHEIQERVVPCPEHMVLYDNLYNAFADATDALSDLSEQIAVTK